MLLPFLIKHSKIKQQYLLKQLSTAVTHTKFNHGSNHYKKNKLSQKQVLNLNNSAKDINIWKSIIGDRRLIYGKNCKSIEDYKTRYDDNFLYSLANQFIEESFRIKLLLAIQRQ